jgi:hypothetical protein
MGEPVVSEEPNVAGGAPVGDLRQRHAEKPAGVVGEPPQIVVLDAGVGDQESEVAGAEPSGDADGDGEGPEAAAELDNVPPSRRCRPWTAGDGRFGTVRSPDRGGGSSGG